MRGLRGPQGADSKESERDGEEDVKERQWGKREKAGKVVEGRQWMKKERVRGGN